MKKKDVRLNCQTLDRLNGELWNAARDGDIKKMKELVDAGADGVSWAFQWAVECKQFEAMKFCVKLGLSTTAINIGLRWASYTGNIDVVNWCFELGATDITSVLKDVSNGNISFDGMKLCVDFLDNKGFKIYIAA